MRNKLLNLVGVVVFIGFITVGVANIRSTNNKIKFKEIELKSQEVKLKQLDERYQEVLDKKANTEAEKQEQQKKIEELEAEKQRLQRDLQAKLDKQQADKEKLAKATKKASGTQTVSALASGCEALRAQMLELGVGAHEIDSAIKLAMRESSCNHNARNKSSNACGAYQSLPCGKWGAPGTTEYLQGAINYARDRYGDYNNALAHSYANNWY